MSKEAEDTLSRKAELKNWTAETDQEKGKET